VETRDSHTDKKNTLYYNGDGIAQLIQRFLTGCTVRGSNSGEGEIFRTPPERPWSLASLLYHE
jgi:hypothetical protein